MSGVVRQARAVCYLAIPLSKTTAVNPATLATFRPPPAPAQCEAREQAAARAHDRALKRHAASLPKRGCLHVRIPPPSRGFGGPATAVFGSPPHCVPRLEQPRRLAAAYHGCATAASASAGRPPHQAPWMRRTDRARLPRKIPQALGLGVHVDGLDNRPPHTVGAGPRRRQAPPRKARRWHCQRIGIVANANLVG